MLGDTEAEELCLVPAESTFTAIQPKIVHVQANEKALRQLHMLRETATVRAQIIHEGENAAPFELVLNLAFRSGPFR